METPIYISILFLAAFNFYASYKCIGCDAFTSNQKAVQTVIIWIFPVLGGLFIIHMANEQSGDASRFHNYANNSADSYPGPQQKIESGSGGDD